MAREGERPTPLSHVAAGVSGLLVALLVGYLAFDATRSKTPPQITAAIVSTEVRREGDRAYVPVDVVNEGGEAATQVVVEIAGKGGEVGTQTVIDYLAGGEARRIVALVPSNPEAAYRAHVVSYQEP